MEWIPVTFHKLGVTAACLEPGGDGLEGRSNHTASESFGVADELLTLVLRLDMPVAKGSPPSRPCIEHAVDLRERCRRGISPEDGHGRIDGGHLGSYSGGHGSQRMTVVGEAAWCTQCSDTDPRRRLAT